MYSRFLFHLVLLFVFLFGSTLSCVSAFEIQKDHYTPHSHELYQDEVHSHGGDQDECCPDDGHTKQIEDKEGVLVSSKKVFDPIKIFENYIDSDDSLRRHVDHRCAYTYHDPPYDRQGYFWTQTIRLLI